LGGGPPSFLRGFTCPVVLRVRLGETRVSATGFSPSVMDHSRSLRLPSSFVTPCETPYNPKGQVLWFGLIPFRSPLLRESRLLSLPQGTKMFQFPWSASQHPMYSGEEYCSITNSGFPHSEISGSTLTYSSPKHIGVSPVLHRLLAPRHSPCALYNLTIEDLYFTNKY
jgi:hypothetical protein